MNISLVDAMMLRDGGTTYVSLHKEDEGNVTYTFDYSLPWNDRPRFIVKVKANEPTVKLAVGSQQEREVCECVKAVLVQQFGRAVVEAFEQDPTKNPGEGKWSYAFNFLRLAIKERKLGSRSAG